MFRKFLLHFEGNLFCKIFNFKSILLRKKIRFSFDYSSKTYTASEKSKKILFSHRKQALYSYNTGIENRIKKLKKKYMLEKLVFNKGDIVVDVGANVGDFYQCFDQVDFQIKYIAFEPSNLEFYCLKKNTKGMKYKNALWSKKSKIKFYSASETADSSLIKPKGYDNIYSILAHPLSHFLTRKKIKLLKLEGEGAEPEIINGAKRILNNIEYITADLGYERGEKESSTLEQVTNFLLKNNFDMIKFNQEDMTALFENNYKK